MILIILSILSITLPMVGGHASLALLAVAGLGFLALRAALAERADLPETPSHLPIRDRRGGIRLDLAAQ